MGPCSEGQSPINLKLTKELWREDLDYLKEKITTKHLNPYHRLSKEAIDVEYATALKTINLGSNSEAALALTSFASKFGDGHTYARPYKAFSEIPLYFRWFNDRLYVQNVEASLQKYLGWEIVKFGGFTPEEVLDKVSNYIANGESKGYIINEAQYVLRLTEMLNALKVSKEEDVLTLTVRNENGIIDSFDVCLKQPCSLTNMTNTFKKEPLRFQRFNEKLWYKTVTTDEGVIGYFNFISYLNKKEMKAFGKRLNKWIEEGNFNVLLIDFRTNGGGDGKKGERLLNIVKETIQSKKIIVYVGIGNMTFSAGMGNASDFQKGLNAKFIGQPTAARPNGYQENNSFTLPNSNIPCSYSSEYYTYSDKDTSGIIPDILIEYDWKGFYNGQDPVIDWIMNTHFSKN
ncbi:hypothetical protein D7030_04690 [Flavobacteriaceae bacterium AU392]|nr:hypothetical protein D1817_11165 [Flavobacteriaceae bacterium]RKM85973.1 hypothetical protein D7030_04690 [Flavobacteriaceae bacterium AU392]